MSISGFLVLIGVIQTVSSEGAIQSIVCASDKTLTLVCPKGRTIDILSAVYGSVEPTRCNDYEEDPSNCEATSAFAIVKDKCNLRQRCTINSFNELFGHPCKSGTYLEVIHQCLKNYQLMTSITCQFRKFHIECPPGELIKITNAWYGYKNHSFCNYYEREDGNCGSHYAHEVMIERCDNKNICNMLVHNDFLRNPCPDVAKYLEVDHMCYSRSLHPFRKIVCENETMFIRCPKGQVIHILTAIFGKKDPKLCNQPGMHATNCEAGGTLPYVKNRCEARQSCYLKDIVNFIGDPCLGVWKYLDVTYDCMDANIKTSITCQAETLKLDCGSAYIRVAKAVYGRDHPLTCNEEKDHVLVNHCGNTSSFDVVRRRCDNEKQCTIGARNEEFGNPCEGTSKFLHVDYLCNSFKIDFAD